MQLDRSLDGPLDCWTYDVYEVSLTLHNATTNTKINASTLGPTHSQQLVIKTRKKKLNTCNFSDGIFHLSTCCIHIKFMLEKLFLTRCILGPTQQSRAPLYYPPPQQEQTCHDHTQHPSLSSRKASFVESPATPMLKEQGEVHTKPDCTLN